MSLAAVLAAVLALAVIVTVRLESPLQRVIRGRGINAATAQPSYPPLARPSCGFSATLVPDCGVLWGMAPLAHTTTPITQGLGEEEDTAGRPMDILHVYHTNNQLFPSATERALAYQPGRNRLLLINWKPATDMSWHAVAVGGADARIDRLAAYIRSTFRHRFFLAVWHEPENDVVPAAGSGMTAVDYAAMYRHVVLRLRADGVSWAVTVMDYMGYDRWALQSWFHSLWPGSDVVDWIGLDPYANGSRTYNPHDLSKLVNTPSGSFPGYYSWAKYSHPGKPIMLAEWGVNADPTNPLGQANVFAAVRNHIVDFPLIKALVYFDMPTPPPGQPRTYLRSNYATIAAYRTLGRVLQIVSPRFTYPV